MEHRQLIEKNITLIDRAKVTFSKTYEFDYNITSIDMVDDKAISPALSNRFQDVPADLKCLLWLPRFLNRDPTRLIE